MRQRKAQRSADNQRTLETQALYTIPVVVHVIHNGEAVGTGTNLSTAQIESQIDVLNKDFQRLNTDKTNTPSGFLPVAGSMDVQFVLAKQDPIGAPTNGIVRTQGTQPTWSINENAIFKALSYWPAEKYFNIWVVKFHDETLGYAQYPVSNLPGLEDSPEDRLTDGIVISYTAFGSTDYGSFTLDSKYNKGRTVTHETGHFFGLRHIWGDDGSSCSGTDYVNDTPNQAGNYLNQCPTTTRTSCTSDDMYMNYMDYTNDACMNMFTVEQFGRVNIVMQNSPRRFSLLNSAGASAPVPVAIDLAIKKIIIPGTSSCGNAITPSLQIQNLGTSNVTSARVQLKVNNAIIQTKDFPLNLTNLQTGEIQFSSYTPGSSPLIFNFEILLVNGVTDPVSFNNTSSITTTIPTSTNIPIAENFDTMPPGWKIQNPDNIVGWALINTESNGNSLYLNSYDYENQGALDQLISPALDLTTVSFAYLKFDRAYEYYGSGYEDRLRILVSTSCDFSNSPIVIFDKSGSELSTALSNTGDSFSPSAAEWKTEIISLGQFVGSKIQISFESINAYGNNQFLDNIIVASDQLTDLSIVSLDNPSPVSCNVNSTPSLRVKNLGTTPITSFKVQTTLNNQAAVTQTISNVNIQPGVEQAVSLSPLTLQSGSNSILTSISDPNGFPDSNPGNNSFAFKRVVNSSSDIIPLRENFENEFLTTWSIVSQGQQEVWTPTETDQGTSLAFTSFGNPNRGEESWLVSPVMDLSRALEASLFFDNAYAYNSSGDDRLRVMYSEDCGATFSKILFSESGAALSTTESNTSWIPSDENDWRRNYIDLNQLAGKSNLRFAFIATAQNGNNQYLDNIEFFIDDDSDPLAVEEGYSVYGEADQDLRVTFNLAERQPVDLRIYNMNGQLILQNTLPETLNQTYFFDMGFQSTGIYIVKVQYGSTVSARRIYIFN
jgi:Pregnancy-associated plasma protein-A/CARDB